MESAILAAERCWAVRGGDWGQMAMPTLGFSTGFGLFFLLLGFFRCGGEEVLEIVWWFQCFFLV